MSGLTPEREAEIRDWITKWFDPAWTTTPGSATVSSAAHKVRDLLAALDAAREDRDEALSCVADGIDLKMELVDGVAAWKRRAKAAEQDRDYLRTLVAELEECDQQRFSARAELAALQAKVNDLADKLDKDGWRFEGVVERLRGLVGDRPHEKEESG